MNILLASQVHLLEINMKVDDFAQFLIKLDRNKAPVAPRNRNAPVWEIETTSDASDLTPVSIITYIYTLGAGFRWDGSIQWNGVGQWGDPDYTLDGWPIVFPYVF